MTTPGEQTSSTASAYSELISLAVHELRTPASVVGGYLRMLVQIADPALDERQRKMISEAEKSCARIVGLIGELSDVGKLDGGTAPFKEGAFDLFETLADLAASVHEAEEREVHLQIRGDSAAPMVGDVARIRSAFTAFFRAVLREQPSAGQVIAERRTVKQGAASSAVVVIAAEVDIARAYEIQQAPFNEMRGGLGLTLPIARRVIERHRGRVWSPAADAGAGASLRSAIIVSLPLSSEASPAERSR